MNELVNSLLQYIPEEHRATIGLLAILSPYITRAYYALINGKGLRGVFSSIWLGTNTPKSHGNDPEIKP